MGNCYINGSENGELNKIKASLFMIYGPLEFRLMSDPEFFIALTKMIEIKMPQLNVVIAILFLYLICKQNRDSVKTWMMSKRS